MSGKARSGGKPDKPEFYIERDRLVARFPNVHDDAEAALLFQRTLRVPDDGKVYPLPAGLGHFSLSCIEDFEQHLPPSWADRGGVVMPMRRGDAMWIGFDAVYPCAIKIGTGKINVLSGRRWSDRLKAAEHDYLVTPPQAALDGFRTRESDIVRQFVAVPLRSGYSVEEQISGHGQHGGIQVVVHPMKAASYALWRAQRAAAGGKRHEDGAGWSALSFHEDEQVTPLAIAAGGRMQQRILADPFGIGSWDQSARVSCFISLVDAEELARATGSPVRLPPPLSRVDYERENLPWFEYDTEGMPALGGASDVPEIRSIKRINDVRGLRSLEADEPIKHGRRETLRLVTSPRRTRHRSPLVRAYWKVRNRLSSR